MKNKMFLIFAFTSLHLLAVEGSFETNIKLNSSFTPRYEAENVYPSKFRFEKLGYDLSLAKLNIKPIEGLNLNLDLKSSRKNIVLNDYAEDSLKPVDKRDYNHDLMAKIGADYTFNIKEDLSFTNSFDYYVDNFLQRKEKLKDGTILEEYGVEFIDENGNKNLAGNTIFKSQIKGKATDKVDIDISAEYKANQLVRFDKDESYFKLSSKVDAKLDNLSISSKYNFDIDLDMKYKKFDAFDTDLDEFPDYMVGNHVTMYNQSGNVEFKYLPEKDDSKYTRKNEYLFEIKAKNTAFILGGERLDLPNTTFYNIIEPSFTAKIQKVLNLKNSRFVFTNRIDNDFEIRHTKYNKIGNAVDLTEYAALYKPTLTSRLGYEIAKDNMKLDAGLSLGYGLPIVFSPELTPTENLQHNIITRYDVNYENQFNDKEKINLKSDLEVQSKYKKSNNKVDLTINSNSKLEYVNKAIDKFEIGALIENKIKTNTQKKRLNIDKFEETLNANASLKYKAFSNSEHNLDLSSKLEFAHNSTYNYVLFAKEKEIEFENTPTTNSEEKENYGKNKLTSMQNKVILSGALNYDRNIRENLKLNSKLELEANVDTLVLRQEKMYHYKTNDLKSYQENPQLSDDYKTNVNVGGKISIKPSVSVSYSPIEKLELLAAVKGNIEFEKKVVNKIEDKDRIDKGLFGPIDKKFEFRKLEPVLELGIKYSW